LKRTLKLILPALALTAGAFAQSDAELIDKATAAAPRQQKDGATVIKFKADGTYDTVKKGTNRLVCYDRSGEPGRAAFAVQCTSIGNMDRIIQDRKFEAELDKTKRQAALDKSEADGSRVKPEYGSVWYDMNGTDKDHARIHVTIALPGATSKTTGLPDTPTQGGAWLMNAGSSTAHIMTPGS
jgi:hypothetical protein